MANILTQSARDLENGVFVQASTDGTTVSILVTNWKARNQRVTDLTITLPASVSGIAPNYYLVDSGHSDAFDSSPDDGTLQTLAAPAVVAGTITLSLQPRSVHLLQFTPPPPPPHLAAHVFGNASVVIDGHDISSQVYECALSSSMELLDITLIGDAAHRYAPGLQATTFTMQYFHEYGTSSIDSILWGLLGSLGFTITVRPYAYRAVAVDNPAYSATYTFFDYQAFMADVGNASTGAITFTAVSALTVATS